MEMMFESTRKRSELEMTADILRVAVNGVCISHLVYQTNSNFKIIEKYLKNMKKCNLINKPDKKVFKTTDKGLKYLNHFEDIQNYLKSDIELDKI